jgi:hypothetical protein
MKFKDINLDTWYKNRLLTSQVPKHFTLARTKATKDNMHWVLEKLHGRFAMVANVSDNDADFLSYYQKTFAFEDPKEAVQFELTWS